MRNFGNFQNFYEFVSDNSEIREKSSAVGAFCEAVQKINVGCGCQKKARIARAERYYLALAHELSVQDKELIASHVSEGKYKLLHKNKIFLKVE